jgi:hypothetical protein
MKFSRRAVRREWMVRGTHPTLAISLVPYFTTMIQFFNAYKGYHADAEKHQGGWFGN